MRNVQLWDVNTGQCKLVFSHHQSVVRCVCVLRLSDGKLRIASGSLDKTVKVLQLSLLLLPSFFCFLCVLMLLTCAFVFVVDAFICQLWDHVTGRCTQSMRGEQEEKHEELKTRREKRESESWGG